MPGSRQVSQLNLEAAERVSRFSEGHGSGEGLRSSKLPHLHWNWMPHRRSSTTS